VLCKSGLRVIVSDILYVFLIALFQVEPSINFGIINSITKLHLVGISTESSTMHGSMNIKFTVGT
jgi:hypothetical protein